MTPTKSTWIAAVCLLAAGTLGACNTVEGLGRDTSAAGRGISNTARQGDRDIHSSSVEGCADALHQDRPGGTDYHGPAEPACEPR